MTGPMETTVQTRHLANLAGAIAEAVEGEPETVESFRSMYGPATVVRDGAGADVILEQAKKDGMTTLKQDGIIKVFQGSTDMSEVRRVCIN